MGVSSLAMPDDDYPGERPADAFDRTMSVLYAVSTVLLTAYIVDVLTDGAVMRAAAPAGGWCRAKMHRVGERLRRDRQWRQEAPAVVWEAIEMTMDAAEGKAP